MKKKTFLFLSAMLLVIAASCQKDPDFDELSSDFLTYTDYSKGADFASFATFYLPDAIKVLSSRVENWTDDNAKMIVTTFANNMEERGYTRITEPELRHTADLGIQLSYVENSYYVTNYYSPYYWYDWWWGYNYWPAAWYPAYPSYAVTYSYEIGSLLGEMIYIDEVNSKIEPVWSMCIAGTMSGSTRTDVNRTIRGINQAFIQSPYIKK